MKDLKEKIELFVKIISQLKYISPQKLIITKEEEKTMKKYFFKNRIYKRMLYGKWRNKVINHHVSTLSDIESACKEVLKNDLIFNVK